MPISTIGSNSLNQTSDLTINGQTVGKGGGNVATNTVHGVSALAVNTSGASNTAIGSSALQANTTASNNTAVGYQAGYSGVTAPRNTCIGYKAGYANTTGYNCFIGTTSGVASTGYGNTFVGADYANGCGALVTSGNNNTIIGGYSGNQGGLDIRTSSNNIVLSDGDGTPQMSYTNADGSWRAIQMYNNTSGSGANMVVLSSGTIARSTSSLKYKRDVQDATHGLAEVLQLRPVTYKGKSEKDGETVFGGLIAEEVHEAGLTEFVQYAEDGSPDALNYGNMVSLAFKAIQELKTIVDAQAAEIAELKAKVA